MKKANHRNLLVKPKVKIKKFKQSFVRTARTSGGVLTLEKLEKRIKELERQKEILWPPFLMDINPTTLDPRCLHNGCDHENNLACNLYCPHCAPRC